LINSQINVADDGICPKATLGMGPLDGFVVRNCTVRSKSHAIKFGSNTDTDMMNIVFDNITIWDSNAGLSIQQRSQGNLHNITFSNIQVETRYQAGRWWGNGEWLDVTRIPRHEGGSTGEIRNLRFVNITARTENGGLLSGFPNRGIQNVSFENVYVKVETWSNYSANPQSCCAIASPPKDEDEADQGGTSLATRNLQEHIDPSDNTTMSCLGSRDYRPWENTPQPDCPRGHDRVPGHADGIFVEHVVGLRLKNVTVEFASPRKFWFGQCIHVCNPERDLEREKGVVDGVASVRCINGSR
jgi:hypothetical protein